MRPSGLSINSITSGVSSNCRQRGPKSRRNPSSLRCCARCCSVEGGRAALSGFGGQTVSIRTVARSHGIAAEWFFAGCRVQSAIWGIARFSRMRFDIRQWIDENWISAMPARVYLFLMTALFSARAAWAAFYIDEDAPVAIRPIATATPHPSTLDANANAAAVPAAIRDRPPRTWTLTASQSLRGNLERWVSQAGYRTLEWRALRAVQTVHPAAYTGSFLDALQWIANGAPELDFLLLKDQRILRVVDAGLEARAISFWTSFKMWMLIPLIMLLMCLSGYTVHIQQQAANAQADAEAAITGDRMRIYLNAVHHYARVHPDFNGTVDESALALPSWFLKSWNMGHVLASSRVYVYRTAAPPGLIGYLSESMTDDLIRVGINRRGVLVGPDSSGRTDTLPSRIPEGSVVIAS